MVDTLVKDNHHLAIIAPFIDNFDPEKRILSGSIPKNAEDRLLSGKYSDEQMPDNTPSNMTLHLIPTNTTDSNTELSVDQLIERQFGTQQWQNQVQKAMTDTKLILNNAGWVDEPVSGVTSVRNTRDDNLFSLRVDNLPDGMGQIDLMQLLREYGCDYFTRVVVPRDEQGTFKRFGFVKFERLRYALKCLEDCPKMKVDNMVINLALVI